MWKHFGAFRQLESAEVRGVCARVYIFGVSKNQRKSALPVRMSAMVEDRGGQE